MQTYDDLNPEQIESLSDTQQHRPVDIEVVRADKEGAFQAWSTLFLFTHKTFAMIGYVKTYIVLPSVIYGVPRGILAERGIQNPHSILIPLLVRPALARGRGGMVGRGQNTWPAVDIEEGSLFPLRYFGQVRDPHKAFII